MRRAVVRMVASVIGSHVNRGVSDALRSLRWELYVQRLHRSGVRRAKSLAPAAPLRLNLGCGFHPKPGWVNVDLIDGADLQLDLREPFPFADGSVSQIYSSHMFEHLRLAGSGDSLATELETAAHPSDALSFLRECGRVLTPGGRLDLVVPDAELAVRAYLQEPGAGSGWWGPAWCDTPMHRLNYEFRQGREHQYAYDFETLRSVLERAGFVNVARRPFDGALDPGGRACSLFLVAFKPEAVSEQSTAGAA